MVPSDDNGSFVDIDTVCCIEVNRSDSLCHEHDIDIFVYREWLAIENNDGNLLYCYCIVLVL